MGAGLDGDQGLTPRPTAVDAPASRRKPVGRRLAGLRGCDARSLLLAGPMGWLVVAYLGSLAVLFVAAFWRLDTFSGRSSTTPAFRTSRRWSTTTSTAPSSCARSVIAAAVTVTDALLAFPIAFYMAKVASPRMRGAARGRGADAAVVELPGEGLRLAHHPLRGRHPELGCSSRSGCTGRASATSPPGSCSRYLWLPFMILPIYAGLERIPNSLLDASATSARGAWTTFRRVMLPLALPAVVAGSIFTFSLTLGDYITPTARVEHAVHRQRRLRERRRRQQPAARRRVRHRAGRDHDRLPPDRPAAGSVRAALMHLSRGTRWLLRIGTGFTLAFIYVPLVVIAIYAFNESRSSRGRSTG